MSVSRAGGGHVTDNQTIRETWSYHNRALWYDQGDETDAPDVFVPMAMQISAPEGYVMDIHRCEYEVCFGHSDYSGDSPADFQWLHWELSDHESMPPSLDFSPGSGAATGDVDEIKNRADIESGRDGVLVSGRQFQPAGFLGGGGAGGVGHICHWDDSWEPVDGDPWTVPFFDELNFNFIYESAVNTAEDSNLFITALFTFDYELKEFGETVPASMLR